MIIWHLSVGIFVVIDNTDYAKLYWLHELIFVMHIIVKIISAKLSHIFGINLFRV